MRNLVIAKRYAKALFSLALQSGEVESYGQELDGFVQVLKDLPELADTLENRLYPEAAKLAVFNGFAGRAGMSPIMKSFIGLLVEKGRLINLPEISQYYHKLMDDHDNVARAQLRAAVAMDDQVINEIAQTLEKMTGKRITIEFMQDPDLIGGVQVRIGDLVLDGSVRRQLLNFKESMKRGALG